MTTINNNQYSKTKASFQSNYSSSSKSKKFGVGLASIAIPGLGQIINNETPKGIAFFLASVCNYLLLFKRYRNGTLAWVGRIGLGIWSAIDAVKRS